MNIHEIVQYLKSEYYLLEIGGEIIITNKFKRAWNNPQVVQLGNLPAVQTRIPIIKSSSQVTDYKSIYKQFIKEAEVPTYLPLSNGGKYRASAYSIGAERVFKSILLDPKIDKRALLLATKLYYKQQNVARQIIGNYFVMGTWESVYDDFIENTAKGDVNKFIDDALKEGNGENMHVEGI